MPRFISEIHGHLIEARSDGLFEIVHLDGRPISRQLLYLSSWKGHHFDFTDEEGRVRHGEVRWVDRSWGLGVAYRVILLIDGHERGELPPAPASIRAGCCLNCGYSLAGLDVVNGELRCPECGRHTPAALAGASPRDAHPAPEPQSAPPPPAPDP
jgi:hypothetical protein